MYEKNILLEKIKSLENEIKNLKSCKRYWLVWEEKIEKFDEETIWKLPVLEEVKKYDIQNDDSESNILIEWDNYHTLSVLNYTHKGKIDVIYIDPPYNTWNKDFIYNDKIIDKEDRFRHSKWLSFMNKRLKLAKDLLSENGIIFISIDDNEVAQLKLLCDEYFKEENFIWKIIWANKEWWWGSDSKYFKIKHEYILVYAKNKEKVKIEWLEQKEDKSYNWKDEYIKERWKFKLIKLNSFSLWYIKSLDFWIIWNDWKKYFPNKWNEKVARWRWSEKKVKWWIENDFLVFKNWNVYTKQYFKVDNENKQIKRTIVPNWIIEQFSSTMWTKQLDNIFWYKAFSYSKPYLLINYLLKVLWWDFKNSTILDFFAGSWTTGHAVMELNKQDWWNRKYILATNNENNICENVTYERLKRVMGWYKNLKWEEVEWLGGNLKYLKTDFIDKHNSNDDLRKRMVDRCSELLCLKENIWESCAIPLPLGEARWGLTSEPKRGLTIEENKINSKIKIFKTKNKYLAILYDMFFMWEFKKILNNLEEKESISIYAFSHYKINWDDFEDLKMNFEIEEIPDPILEVYDSIFAL